MHVDDEHMQEVQDAKDVSDRRFVEVLQELRVVQTGVQILFAYLLTLPFSNRFSEITQGETVVYVLTLCATAAATAFLIAPVSYHRLTKPDVGKSLVVKMAARMAQAGLLMLLLAVTGAVYLVMDIVLHGGWAATITSLLSALFVGLWYVIPVIARLQHETKEH
jgi:hypothetical protein